MSSDSSIGGYADVRGIRETAVLHWFRVYVDAALLVSDAS